MRAIRIRAVKSKGLQDDGASAVEYALLITAIAAVIVLVVFAFGGLVANIHHSNCESINDGVSSHSDVSVDCDAG